MSFTESVDELVERNENHLLGKSERWERVALHEVCDILNGFAFSSKQFSTSEGVPLIRIRDVQRGWTETYYTGTYDAEYLVKRGELVVGMDGDFNAALWQGNDALLNQRVCKLTPDPRYYDVRFLSYVLPGYLAVINRRTSSMTVKHLSSKTVSQVSLPLPPLSEQAKLVEVLDSQTSRIQASAEILASVGGKLKSYRASVLKAAVEGRLIPTEAELAQEEGRDYEPASVLLERILAERRRRWEEAELAKMEAKGKSPKDESWKAKYKEPAEPEGPSELPCLPEGWCWSSLDQLGQISGGITQNSKRRAKPLQVPFLRVANVYANRLDLEEVKEIGVDEGEFGRACLVKDDLLVVEGNGSIDQIGRVALWDGSIDPCLHQNHLIKARFALRNQSSWVLLYLLSPAGRRAIERAASSTSGLHTLSLSKVAGLQVPLPPTAEQDRISEEVERLTSVANAAVAESEQAKGRCSVMRQAILKWAFEGKLVEQDPNDEPAATLLKRIHSASEAAPPKTRLKRREKSAATPT